jgi:hypothetical protein
MSLPLYETGSSLYDAAGVSDGGQLADPGPQQTIIDAFIHKRRELLHSYSIATLPCGGSLLRPGCRI